MAGSAPIRSRDLVLALLREGQAVRFEVMGGSMRPHIWPGDIVEAFPVSADDVSVGDIVIYGLDDSFRVHRVKTIQPQQNAQAEGENTPTPRLVFTCRGDGMIQDDPPILSHQILGRVTDVLEARKSIRVRTMMQLWRLSRKLKTKLLA